MSQDLMAAMSLAREHLPRSSRWPILGTALDWTFAGSWQRIDGETFGMNESEAMTFRPPLLVFGEYAFDGGASPLIGLHESDGTVHGIDLERPTDPVFSFNSSLAAFVETFVLLDSALRTPSTPLWSGLREQVKRIDPVAFDKSDWAGLLQALS